MQRLRQHLYLRAQVAKESVQDCHKVKDKAAEQDKGTGEERDQKVESGGDSVGEQYQEQLGAIAGGRR